jgi:hypothetical protein
MQDEEDPAVVAEYQRMVEDGARCEQRPGSNITAAWRLSLPSRLSTSGHPPPIARP